MCHSRTALIVSCFSLLVLSPFLATAHGQASFQSLGDLPGGLGSQAFGVSADGSVVVGFSYYIAPGGLLQSHAFRWTQAGGMQAIFDPVLDYTSAAFAVSADGLTVGGWHAPTIVEEKAFMWSAAGGEQVLDTRSGVQALSGNGSVGAGYIVQGRGEPPRAATWTGGARTFIDSRGVIVPGSQAQGISGDGSTVVGLAMFDPITASRAFRWTAAQGMQNIGSADAAGPISAAYAISPNGTFIVGGASTASNPYFEAFRWVQGIGMQSLGTLSATGDTTAYAVSADGQTVVGAGLTPSGMRAFVWRAQEGLQILQDALGDAVPAGLTLAEARGVSADGLAVVGNGTGGPWIAKLSSGPASELYVTTKTEQGGGKPVVYVLQGNAVKRSWTVHHGNEFGLAIDSTVRTIGVLNVPAPGDVGAEYSLAGVPTGTSYPFPINSPSFLQFLDGATDGPHNYAWDLNNNTAWRLDENWANPSPLFTIADASSRLGLAYDSSNNSLWLSGYGSTTIENRSLTGTLLRSFSTGHNHNAALALDPADGTLWLANQAIPGQFEQYSRSGVLMSTMFYNPLAGLSVFGGEFQISPQIVVVSPPAPMTLIAGQTASFSVEVVGAPTFTYHWRKDTVPLTDGGTISGALGPLLTIAPTAGTDAGNYDVEITNGCCTQTSPAATLTIHCLPMDFDCNGHIDHSDLIAFTACFSGAGVPPDGTAPCAASDLDHDGDVDQADFGIFQRCFSGANKPPDPNCAN